MRSHDWSQTPLGPVDTWPQSLRTTVSILLNSRYPMFVWWGPQYANLYNDAYRPILGASKHPHFLGQSAKDCWAEIWDVIGERIARVVTAGEPTWAENFQFLIDRYGYIEETYFTFSYSPVRDESGGIGGVFCACTETTQQVLGERRLRTLRDLAAQTGEAKTVEVACQIAAKTLANNPADIPFALLYLLDEAGEHAHLAGLTGLEPDTPASPTTIDLSETVKAQDWSLATVMHTNQVERVEAVLERFGALSVGRWEESPHTALVLPVASPGQDRPTGLLVAGISSRLALDDDYQGFLELVAGQVAAAIADARAYEAERQRAEALAEIDRAKTIFFSNVSHEFRTPLTLMLAPLEDALTSLEGREKGEGRGEKEDQPRPSPPASPALRSSLKEQLQIAQRNGRRLLKLVNTLLDFSRIEAGRIQAVYQPTNLATFTTDLASTFRSLIERAGMTLVVDCPPLPEPVYVDREMWEKIVLNLLSNAFKFTFAGEIRVSLRVENGEERGEREDQVTLSASPAPPTASFLTLEIQDTGIGIPPNEIPHLFERFHRVKGAQGRSFEGSGIGLSLVQELVKLHGGNIQVFSQTGQGSCITVTLPTGSAHLPAECIGDSRTLDSTAMGATPYVEEAWGWLSEQDLELPILDVGFATHAPAPAPVAANLAQAEQPFPAKIQPSKPKILVVDDNADMREYIKRLLERFYTVETATNGVEALTTIHRRLPDLVLTDVMMPQLDGFGLLADLRTNAKTRELPIILLSARAGEEAHVEGLEAGADDYLVKPFSSRELMARVEANLKMARMRQETTLREQALRLTAEQAQRETAATFEQLTHLLETMSDAFIALDRNWRITYQNTAAERINHGKPRSQVLGKTHWQEWPDSVGTEMEYQYRQAMAKQVPVHFEHHYYAPPHFDVWLEIHAYPSEEGLGIFFRDITERKQSEAQRQQAESALRQSKAELETRVAERTIELQAANDRLHQELLQREQIEASLQESDRRWRSLLDNVELVVVGLDIHSTIEYVNPFFLKLTGYQVTEVIGQNWLNLFLNPSQRSAFQTVFREILEHNWHTHHQNPIVTQSGEERMIAWNNTVLRDVSGQAIGIVGIGEDITERYKVERMKAEFISVVSHELRTPLTSMQAALSLLSEKIIDPTSAEGEATIQIATDGVDRLVRLVNDILDLERLESGKVRLEKRPCNVRDLVDTAIAQMQELANQAGITLETGPCAFQVYADGDRLLQVLTNLLSNAIKFSPPASTVFLSVTLQPGEPSIAESRDQNRDQNHDPVSQESLDYPDSFPMLLFTVTDQGRGIPVENLESIFDRFHQVDASDSREKGGTGLGLAICRSIVRQHGGEIWAESVMGEGSQFSFTVPMVGVEERRLA
jgi:PAS domain S-box-containing protein